MYIYEIKKSKFIAYSFDIKSKEDVNNFLQEVHIKNKNANHFCYAYVTHNSGGMSDDGEPKGTAGKPLFNLLKLKKQKNKLIIVVRYYGGKKLGASGLIRAYINAAKNEI